jgi:YfiH family protein
MTIPLLHQEGLFPPWLRWGFTTRHGGVSQGNYESLNLGWDVGDDPACVRENHRRLGEALGYDPEMLAVVRQVHGKSVYVVRKPDEGRALRGKRGDGMLLVGNSPPTAHSPQPAPKAPLAALVRVADCCPVLLAALDHPVAAVLHCGWRSTVHGLIAAGIAALRREAGRPDAALAAAIGPCIGPESFEVGEEVAAVFEQKVSFDVVLRRPQWPKPHVALQDAVRLLLVRAGVPTERIAVFSRDTFIEPADFFSFRRDGHDGGRQCGIVVLDRTGTGG